MKYTIGKLANQFKLSRSTLLYYDKIQLLPSDKSEAGYRLYTEEDRKRLERIVMLRSFGLPLEEIKSTLSKNGKQLYPLLEEQFHHLNKEIVRIKNQQRLLVSLLKDPSLMSESAAMTKEKWVSLLKASGLSEREMNKWHIDFERSDPDKHQEFLEFLGIPLATIVEIRKKSSSAK